MTELKDNKFTPEQFRDNKCRCPEVSEEDVIDSKHINCGGIEPIITKKKSKRRGKS